MIKTIYQQYDKSLIPSLPAEQFEGRIFVIDSADKAEGAINYLMSHHTLGFDTETRPSFRHGQMHKVALLQVSTTDTCFLFRLNRIDMPQPVIKLLSDTHIQKIGLSLHDDISMLQRRQKFNAGTFIDIQNEVKQIGITDMSLQKIYANLFGRRINKRQQLSNWEADILSEPQKRYAATDAWACIKIYEEIVRLNQTKEYKLIKHETDNTETK